MTDSYERDADVSVSSRWRILRHDKVFAMKEERYLLIASWLGISLSTFPYSCFFPNLAIFVIYRIEADCHNESGHWKRIIPTVNSTGGAKYE